MNVAHQSGFTLIELLVVVVIIGVLASVGLPLSELASKRAKEEELRAALRQIRTALDAYKKASDENRIERAADATGYPGDLANLVDGVVSINNPDKRLIYFLRRIPRDPFADTKTSAIDSWALRSYESPPDAPKPGRDVFDVYSKSTGIGLNGIPYKDW
ncbi:type II secretion system GspH family protein [Limnobacter humi]|uniref:Type II secretion system GspH family protein n=1 Tax=Limnobacter humi TaxID=1778671 RepID=A0ABT1WF13_9BURK|nr:type II secretion system GspH family protein [Limnobacter humi]